MQRRSLLQRNNAPWKTGLGIALAVWLMLAESFALAHQYDSAAHSTGESCAICVSAAGFGSANVAAPVHVEPLVAASFIDATTGIVFFSAVPTRRYARGPPAVSFTF
jgi:hypothetical protein